MLKYSTLQKNIIGHGFENKCTFALDSNVRPTLLMHLHYESMDMAKCCRSDTGRGTGGISS